MGSTSRSMVGFAVVGALLLAVPALAQNPANPDPVSYTAFDTPASGAVFRWYVTGTTTTDATIAAHGTVRFDNPEITSRAHNVDFVSDQKPQCKLEHGHRGLDGADAANAHRREVVRNVRVRSTRHVPVRLRQHVPSQHDRHDHGGRPARQHPDDDATGHVVTDAAAGPGSAHAAAGGRDGDHHQA